MHCHLEDFFFTPFTPLQVAAPFAPPVKKPAPAAPVASQKRIRITLTSCDVKAVEKVCSDLVQSAGQQKVKHKGPIRMPTRVLTVTTRKSPCGEGTNTWDRFEMRVYKRVIDLLCPSDQVKAITSIQIAPSVEVEVVLGGDTEAH